MAGGFCGLGPRASRSRTNTAGRPGRRSPDISVRVIESIPILRLHGFTCFSTLRPPHPPRPAPLAVGPAQIRRAALPAPPRQAQGKAHLVYSGARIGGNEMRERFAAPPPRPHGRLRGLFSLEADCSCKLQLLVFLDTNACRLAFGLALCLKVGGRRRVRRSCTGRTNLQDLGLGWFAC